jgi:hypothetical protein
MGLEEKRIQGETFLRGAGVKQSEITKANDLAK